MITHEPTPLYAAAPQRYENMSYKRCGNSGIRLPRLSLGLWQNFGATTSEATSRAIMRTAFNMGITHFDLANNYGPPYGAAENTFGSLFKQDFKPYRDELLISSKAGYDMWPGPYGIGGSRKYLVSSCDQSLKRTGLDYFDIYYHHTMDPETPLEETMSALDYIVRSGRALYIGISNYEPEQTLDAINILKDLGTPLLAHQPRYNLLDRKIEHGLTDILSSQAIGAITFSPLAQGLLTDKYLNGIPLNSRAQKSDISHFNSNDITQGKLEKISRLNLLAKSRNQSLAQMSLAWVLNCPAVTSCLVGASNSEQLLDSIACLDNLTFIKEEIDQINEIIGTH